MNTQALIGWGLAVAALAVGYTRYSWPGVALATSVIVFWLLLQFSRALRVMRNAGKAPVGKVPSAVMLHARLKNGLRLMDVIRITRSLGQRRSEPGEQPERFAWRDDSGASVTVELHGGKVTGWTLERPPEPPEVPPQNPPENPPGR